MNQTICRTCAMMLLVLSLSVITFGGTLSVCDYEPPESRIIDLGLQGSFNWYDGPFTDDRNQAMAASLISEYASLFSSPASGWAMEGRAEVRVDGANWSANLMGAGSLSTYFRDDLFGVGALGFDASAEAGFELDLTGGIGKGRFRDVTPLAQANEIQNTLLDLGELFAPIGDDVLLDLAQILGEVGSSDAERLVVLSERLIATELIPGDQLGVRGLLAIEEILTSYDETRLCGYDLEARVGVSARILPEFSLAATGILQARYAVVPTPVSRFRARTEAKFRLANPDELIILGEVSYSHRLPNGWTGRVDYRMTFDRTWSSPDIIAMSHSVFGSFSTQVFGAAGLSIVGDVQYKTGDEELTLTLSVYLEADLF